MVYVLGCRIFTCVASGKVANSPGNKKQVKVSCVGVCFLNSPTFSAIKQKLRGMTSDIFSIYISHTKFVTRGFSFMISSLRPPHRKPNEWRAFSIADNCYFDNNDLYFCMFSLRSKSKGVLRILEGGGYGKMRHN